MIEIYKNIYVGSSDDFGQYPFGRDWALVNACKELEISKNTLSEKVLLEDYLFLNTDSNKQLKFFDIETMQLVFSFVQAKLQNGKNVFIFCDLGGSASPLVLILFLSIRMQVLPDTSFEDAEDVFYDVYVDYNPKPEMRQEAQKLWHDFNNKSK